MKTYTGMARLRKVAKQAEELVVHHGLLPINISTQVLRMMEGTCLMFRAKSYGSFELWEHHELAAFATLCKDGYLAYGVNEFDHTAKGMDR